MTESTQSYATGRRKTAVARVWLKPGSGTIVVNGMPCDTYFERETSRMSRPSRWAMTERPPAGPVPRKFSM